MTYCVAVRLEAGMIFASDTRTNAGVDNISVFKKLHAFGVEGERMIIVQTAGNLATSQAVISTLRQDIALGSDVSLHNVTSLFEAAKLVGQVARGIANRSRTLAQGDDSFSSSFLLGGQIRSQPMGLYMIYQEGNSIHATDDTPFFQIGEHKYGKPILDRAVTAHSDIADAIRATLVSFDSTIRSNLSVGYPIDLAVYHRDSLRIPRGKRLDDRDDYLRTIRNQWSSGLLDILHKFDLPPQDYLD